MDDLGSVHVSDTSKDLGDKVLEMGIRQRLSRADDLGQIGFRRREDEVDLGKVDKGGVKVEECGHVVADSNVTEDSNLAEGTASKNITLKDARNLLDTATIGEINDARSNKVRGQPLRANWRDAKGEK